MGSVRNTVNDTLLRMSYKEPRNIKSLLRNWGGLESLSLSGDRVATCILADLKQVTGIDIDAFDKDDRQKFNDRYKLGKLTYSQYMSIAYTLVLGYSQMEVAWVMGVDQSVISHLVDNGIRKIQKELKASLEVE